MFTAKDVVALYWANAKNAYKASFSLSPRLMNPAKEDYLPMVGYFLLIIVWPIELVFMMLNVTLFQTVKTMVDIFTRKPLSSPERQVLQQTCDSLNARSSEEVDSFIAGIIQPESLYQSQNSKRLISTLSNLNEQKLTGRRTYRSSSRTEFTNTPDMEHVNAVLTEVLYSSGFSIAAFLDDSDCVYTALTADEIKENTLKQLEYIKAFIQNPENNGTKLMQYIQTNLSDEMLVKPTRETTLKERAEIEVARLEKKSTFSSNEKSSKIRAALDESTSFDETKLRASLLISRGFFGFRKTMPDSYANVFCNNSAPSNGL